ncbi:amidase [Puniceibacterium sp. IMCC21224]|uniref:amidase n=1 Tax=Puniceibacterium sp. IMCC21224 TaxID=1618204 RepID=UPI00064DBC20|nr:amidase family protein [Puniceibacterium sp. IMCC21224]KMK65203.1 amidase, Asp-tRNAAsn/Glu-tRNAGln amidotransferase A subunit [Puniceibacterium sp. IMCC21224]
MDPADLTALDALSLIRSRKLSPVELAQACIARTEAINPAVNAVIAWNPDQILTEARRAETVLTRGRAGALCGLPVAIKDEIDVKGLPTTNGSELFADHIADGDDAIVTALRTAGAAILGKTNIPEWSAGANTRNRVWGVTANPYDLDKSCAGSSGGSAVALACGMAPLATGSDMGGSLRNPAAFCGVVGFRPSPGVVPGNTRGLGPLWLSTAGPMARNVSDLALLLSVMARPDAGDPYTTVVDGRTAWDPRDLALPGRANLRRIRVAATADFGFAPTEKRVRQTFDAALAALAPSLPMLEECAPDCTGADRIFAVLRAIAFLAQHHDRTVAHPDKVGPNVTRNVEEGLQYRALDVARALADQTSYQRRWGAFFEECDVLISPAVCLAPRPWREHFPTQIDGTPTQSYFHWLANAYAVTLAGHPAVTLPCGLDADGMPFGLQLIGRRHGDAALLAVATAVEATIAEIPSLVTPTPDIAALRAAQPLSLATGFRDAG